MIKIENLDLSMLPTFYTMPDDVSSVAFHAVGADVLMYDAGDMTKCWTIKNGEKEVIAARALSGMKFAFMGNAAKLQMRIFIGLMS